MLKIVHTICNLCGLCQKSCPFGAISVGAETVTVDERCTLCGACVSVCPQSALSIERRQASPEELARYKGVFVWAESEDREKKLIPRKVVYELLTHGRRLAERLGQPLLAVVLGDDRLAGLERLCHQGADRVICCRHELLGRYSTDGFTTALAAVVAKEKPFRGHPQRPRPGPPGGGAAAPGPHRRLHGACHRRAGSARSDAAGLRRQHHGKHRHPLDPAAVRHRAAERFQRGRAGPAQKAIVQPSN